MNRLHARDHMRRQIDAWRKKIGLLKVGVRTFEVKSLGGEKNPLKSSHVTAKRMAFWSD